MKGSHMKKYAKKRRKNKNETNNTYIETTECFDDVDGSHEI